MTGQKYRTVTWQEANTTLICNALRPSPDDPAIAQYADWFKQTCFFMQEGNKIALSELHLDDICSLLLDRKSDGSFPGSQNLVWIIDTEDEEIIVALNKKRLDLKKDKDASALKIEEIPIKAAQESGVDQVYKSWMEDCDASEPDCSFDFVKRMVRPDGTMYVIRTHCY